MLLKIHSLVFKLILFEFSCICLASEKNVNYRLSRDIKPLHYELIIQPNLKDESFTGSVNITIFALASVSYIKLHKNKLKIHEETIKILSENGNLLNIDVVNVTETKTDTHFYGIHLNKKLEFNNSYIICFGIFSGTLDYSKAGFYLAKYTDNNDEEQKLAVTQFEATDARKVFPCFDEPAFKATFQLSIIRSTEYNSISNENLLKTEVINNSYEKDIYKTTKNMSTYLLAFIVSKLNFVKLSDEINFRVFAKQEFIKNNKGDYALKLAPKIMRTLTSLLNISYPLEKIDLVGIPDEFYNFGAMENWGLITFTNSYLLSDQETSAENLQEIAITITHEFAHQWFGNLVTPEWWKYLWLNEGFATYFEVFALSKIQNDWQLSDQFPIKYVQRAMLIDSYASTTPINQNVRTPQEIATLFNEITYEKSGSIIRMTETFLTTSIYLAGLQLYLCKYKYSNTVPSQLYSALQTSYNTLSVSELLPKNATVETVLSNWNSNPGYPLVTVIRNGSSIIFRQTRFLMSNQGNFEKAENTWQIPVTYVIKTKDFQNTTTKFWLTEKEAVINLNLSDSDWMIVNVQQRGFYRVNYDLKNWKILIALLNSENYIKIHRVNRAQIIDDVFNLARSGNLDYNIAFEIANYMKREFDYIPLYSFTMTLDYLDMIMSSQSNYYEIFKKYVMQLLQKVFAKLGIRDEGNHLDKLSRDIILHWVCKFGDAGCIKEALYQVRSWRKNETHRISPNLQKNLFCTAIAFGSIDDWEFLWNKYNKIRSSIVQIRILKALSCTQNQTMLHRYMEDIILGTNSSLPNSHRAEGFDSIFNAGNVGFDVGLQYIYDNYEKVNKVFVVEDELLELIPRVVNNHNLDLLHKISKDYDLKNLSNQILTIRDNIRKINRSTQSITTWLFKNNSGFKKSVTRVILCFALLLLYSTV